MEELRAALKPDRIDEQGEKDRLDAAVDIDAQLSDDDADQQSAGNAAQDKVADFYLPDEIAERDRDEQREQWVAAKYCVYDAHPGFPKMDL